jgi:hypothetical protein
MFDGLHFEAPLINFDNWRHSTGIEFEVPINTDTGEITGRNYQTHSTYTHRAKLGTYDLRVLQTQNGNTVRYLLKVSGSLHKNHFGGANHQRFCFHQLQKEIQFLSNALQICPNEMKLRNLEIGVNIELPFEVSPYIHYALLMHKTTAFIPYEMRNGKSLGLTAKHDQYTVKCYDKGLQFDLPKNLMRFELQFEKMKPLKSLGVSTVADLLQTRKRNAMFLLLVRAWNDTLLNEPQINLERISLSKKERDTIMLGRNRNEWEILLRNDKRGYNYRRDNFKALIKEYGNNTHAQILNLIKTEWQSLQENCTNSPLVGLLQYENYTY